MKKILITMNTIYTSIQIKIINYTISHPSPTEFLYSHSPIPPFLLEWNVRKKIIPGTTVNRKTISPQQNLLSTVVWITPCEYLSPGENNVGKKFKFPLQIRKGREEKEAGKKLCRSTWNGNKPSNFSCWMVFRKISQKQNMVIIS